MAGEQMVGLDYSGNPGASKRPSPAAPTRIAEADVPGGVPGIEARAQGGEVASPAEGFDQLGGAVQQIAEQQNQMQQKTWMLNAGTQYELQARQKLDDMQKSAQPGQMISGDLQTHLTQQADDQTKDIQQPALKAAYTDQLGGINQQLLGEAQKYDFQQRDLNTEYNLQQSNQNINHIWQSMGNFDDILADFPKRIADAAHTIDSLPLDPATRQKLQTQTNDDLGSMQEVNLMHLDPKRFAQEHIMALPPEIKGLLGMQGGVPQDMGGDTVKPYTADQINQLHSLVSNPSGYDAMFHQAGLQYKIDPAELKLHAAAESGMNPKADNGQSQGLMQLTPATAKSLGVTDPFDPQQSIFGAAKLMAQNRDKGATDAATADKMYYGGANTAQWGANTNQYAENLRAVRETDLSPENWRADGSKPSGDMAWKLMSFTAQQQVMDKLHQTLIAQKSYSAMFDGQAQQTLSNFKKMLTDGDVPSDDTIKQANQAISQAVDPKIRAQWQDAQGLLGVQKQMLAMTPADAQTYRTGLQSMVDKGTASPEQVRNLDFADRFVPKMMSAMKSDPVKWYSRSNPVPPVDLGNPDSLRQRAVIAGNLSQQYGVPKSEAFFTKPEADEMSKAFDAAPQDQRRVIVKNMADAFGGNAADATAAFAKTNPNLATAVGMFAQGNVTTAMDIVEGDRRMKDDKMTPVPMDAVNKALAEDYGNIFPPGSRAFDAMQKATQAVYAARYNQTFAAGGNQKDQIIDIAKSIAGEKVNINGADTLAPIGVPADTFQQYTQNITRPQLLKALEGGQIAMNSQPGAQQVSMPKGKDGEFIPGQSRLFIQPIGNGVYRMVDKNGNPYAKGDGSGVAVLRFTPEDIAAPAPSAASAKPAFGVK